MGALPTDDRCPRRRHRRRRSTSSSSTDGSDWGRESPSPRRHRRGRYQRPSRRRSPSMTLRRCQRNSVDRRRKPGRSPPDQRPPPKCSEPESVQAADAAKERPSRERWGFAAGAKLGTYDGSTCVETFLARFRHCARYFRWTAEDQFFQLCASLSGPTGQILWDTGAQQTVEEVMVLLRLSATDIQYLLHLC